MKEKLNKKEQHKLLFTITVQKYQIENQTPKMLNLRFK